LGIGKSFDSNSLIWPSDSGQIPAQHYMRAMTQPESRHKPIEFSGTVQELAHTLGMAVEDITASIAGLIRAGHLERVTGGTWRLKPAR
jgi:hypothetical protein